MTPFLFDKSNDAAIDKLISDFTARMVSGKADVGDVLAEINKLDKPKRKKSNSKGGF